MGRSDSDLARRTHCTFLHLTLSPASMRSALRNLLVAIALPIAVQACGDNDFPTRDAAVPGNDSLAVLNPPGDSIGLDFSGTSTLRVQLVDSEGEPITGQPIEFSLLQNAGESVGGSSLSASSRQTNSIGIAEVDLLAGAERVNFRVEASTPNAPSVLFYIQVSDQGFSDVSIVTAHEGPRDSTSYDGVELRIYSDSSARCGAIDFASPPESLFPPRTQELLGEASDFRNLAVGLGYTVIAWAEAGAEATPHATGCLHIAADRLRSGSAFEAVLPVADLPYQLPQLLAVDTEIQLADLAATLTGQDTWATLSCPLGRAQLLLDCLPDAQTPDALLDCNSEQASPLGTAIEARRGIIGADGCRPATTASGEDSLDALLMDAMTGWPNDVELGALAGGRELVLGTLRIQSEVARTGDGVVTHRLRRADLDTVSVDLLLSSRPVVEVAAVPVQRSASPEISIAPHGFTLRFAELAESGYEILALGPANVSGLGAALGTEFMTEISIAAQTGCAGLEAFVCGELGLGADCADLCSTIAPALDIRLAAWLGDLQSSGLDYTVEAQADLLDDDRNLVIDSATASDDQIVVQFDTDLQSIALPATMSCVAQ